MLRMTSFRRPGNPGARQLSVRPRPMRRRRRQARSSTMPMRLWAGE